MRIPTPEELIAPARAVKESQEEFFPIVFWAPHGRGSILEDLPVTVGELLAEFGSPCWFAVVLDAYATTDPDLDGACLADAFADGDPHVVEQVVLAVASADSATAYHQVYRYIPSEGWEWDPIAVSTADSDLLLAMSIVPLHRD